MGKARGWTGWRGWRGGQGSRSSGIGGSDLGRFNQHRCSSGSSEMRERGLVIECSGGGVQTSNVLEHGGHVGTEVRLRPMSKSGVTQSLLPIATLQMGQVCRALRGDPGVPGPRLPASKFHAYYRREPGRRSFPPSNHQSTVCLFLPWPEDAQSLAQSSSVDGCLLP